METYGTASGATDDSTAHALCVLDNYGYIHKLIPFPRHNVRAKAARYYLIGTLSLFLFNRSVHVVLIYTCFHFSVPMPESYLNDPIFITESIYLHPCINICLLCVGVVDCAACRILLFTLFVLFGCYYASDL